MTPKQPCTDCGALILPETALETGGKCIPCQKGYRNQIEAGKARLEEEKKYDPRRAFWGSMVSLVHGSDRSLNILTNDQRQYFLVNLFNGSLYRSGLLHFLSEEGSEYFNEVIEALHTLGAPKTAIAFRRSAELLFKSLPPPANDERHQITLDALIAFEHSPRPQWTLEFDEIEASLCNNPEGIDGLLERFAETKGLLEPFASPNLEEEK